MYLLKKKMRFNLRIFTLISLLVFLFSTACTSYKVPVSKFNRIDKKVGNVTKHVEESLFKVTDKGLYSVEVLLFDGNLKVGRNDFDIVIHDMKDEDVEGASVKVIAQIPESDIKVKPRIII
jgi:hypothetical protein